jgi:hypothetical protein
VKAASGPTLELGIGGLPWLVFRIFVPYFPDYSPDCSPEGVMVKKKYYPDYGLSIDKTRQ